MADIQQCLAELKASFNGGKTRHIEWRKKQLQNLWHLVCDNEARFVEAITKDTGKPSVMIQAMEIMLVANEIVDCLQNLDEWIKEEPVASPPPFQYWSPVIRRQPKGTCLILGTWNFPLTLSLLPFIGVIAAGNTGILRPSEYTPNTANLLEELFPKYLDSSCFRVINGGKDVAQALLDHPYGHILFTGGTAVAKEVMKSAARFLTPLTLELGGRNAVVVSDKANVELAAKRTAWAKFANAGQICLAPNVVVVHEAVYEQFVAAVNSVYDKFYDTKPDMSRVGRIINAAKWSRVTSLLSSTKGTITRGGSSVESQLFVEPTIVRDVPLDDALLDAEVFGPILPVLRCKDMTDISATLKSISPSPLCFYVFSEDLEEANNMVNTVQCGSAAINDVMAQMVPTSMPFGGIGESGFGAYRGKASIDTFSHKQSVVSVPTSNEFENMLEWRYPYSESKDTVQFLKDNMKAKLS